MPFTVSSSREAHGKRKRRYPREGHTAVQAARQLDDKRHDARAKEEKVSSVVNRLLTQWRAHLLSGGSNNAMSYAGIKALVAKLTRSNPFRRRALFRAIHAYQKINCVLSSRKQLMILILILVTLSSSQ